MSNQEILEILEKQLQLLHQNSQHCEYPHGGTELADITRAMIYLTEMIQKFSD